MGTRKSVCRICSGGCGLIFTFDDDGTLTKVRGDRDHPISRGFACEKGLQAPLMMRGEKRLRHVLRRRPDGSHEQIPLETALDEIAARLRSLIDKRGGESVAFFKGTGGHNNTVTVMLRAALMAALGSENYYSVSTIDQSCHYVTRCRMGYWEAGKQPLDGCDVALLIGTNPLVSLGAYQFLSYDPQKRLKAAKAAGMKLIVIDPRQTETARQADLFLQPHPGEDPTVVAGLVRLVLENGWHDPDFSERWIEGMDALRVAVDPFTPDYVEARAGVPSADLRRAAEMFARDGRRGPATLGTGVSMAPRSNLASHLIECLNVICGRVLQKGDRVPNPGLISSAREFRAQVGAPYREWERSSRTVTGHGTVMGERPTGVLADQILTESPDRVRAMFINGANLAVSVPDQKRIVEALRDLELLVTIDHFMTPTAALSHYVIPANTVYERPDFLSGPAFETYLFDQPFMQYLPPVWDRLEGSEITDEWYVYWGIAQRLGLVLTVGGQALDMTVVPTSDNLLDVALAGARVPIDELRAAPDGMWFAEPVHVLPAVDDCAHRFQVMPQDVAEELAEVAAEPFGALFEGYRYRLISRRRRGVMNSLGIGWETTRSVRHLNPAALHPDDLEALDLDEGDEIELESPNGRISTIVKADPTLRPGVISLSHAWGGLPDVDEHDSRMANSNLLVSTQVLVEKINAMPAMSAIPVNVLPVRTGTSRATRAAAASPRGTDPAPSD